MSNLLTFVGVFLLSWIGVGSFRKWSENRAILDVPNERSSHDVATPVGGGLVIVVLTIVPLAVFELVTETGFRYWGFYVAGAAIALISWFDDIKPVPAYLRFAVHIAAAVTAVIQIGAFTSITLWPGNTISLGILGPALSVLWIVWMTNAYNFMDGIDGLAGTQAVVAAAGWALFASYYGNNMLLFAAIGLMAASMVFLVHNWPPAKVFMGDVGSAFLGFSFAVFPLIAMSVPGSEAYYGSIPIVAVAFVWLFFSDTLLTFFRRAVAGEKLWDAHRKHMYQEMIKAGKSHLLVTLFYGSLMVLVAAASLSELVTRIFGLTLAAMAGVLILLVVVVTKNKKVDETVPN